MRRERVLAIDPGKMTGIALLIREDDEVRVERSTELDESSVIPYIRPILKNWHADDGIEKDFPLRVVIERFTISIQTAKLSPAPYSLEMIGAVKQACRDVGYPMNALVMQNVSDAKDAFPNPKLKKLGLWHRGGAGHALDAIRHGCVYLVSSGGAIEKGV